MYQEEDRSSNECFQRGKSYAFHLLQRRDLSTLEVQNRLKEKQYPPPIIEKVIGYLHDKKLLDDKRFTKEFVRFAIRKGFACRKIEYLLKQKGIAEQRITEALAEVFPPIEEERMARELLYRKRYLPLQQGGTKEDRLKELSRIYRFLMRYGYSYSVIEKLIEAKGVRS